MKNVKQIFSIIIAIALSASPLSAAALPQMPRVDTDKKVYDYAEILSPDEEAVLAGSAGSAISDAGVEFVILTVNDDMGLGMTAYSDEFYEQNGFGGDKFDGVMLYVNMTKRDVYFATYGAAVSMFSGRDIDNVLDGIAPLLSDEQYFSACSEFIKLTSTHIAYYREKGNPGSSAIYGGEGGYGTSDEGIGIGGGIAMSLAAGAAVSLIILMLHSRSLSQKPGISTYFGGRGFTLTGSRDVFLFTNTTRTPIPQNNSSGGGGGAHKTSGGRSAGGGGRKF